MRLGRILVGLGALLSLAVVTPAAQAIPAFAR